MQEKGKKNRSRNAVGLNGEAVRPPTMMNAGQLEAMREVDIRTVDKDALVEISDVKIDTSLTDEERMLEFVRQIGNPYCYLDHGTVVKISFGGSRRLEDCLKSCVRAK